MDVWTFLGQKQRIDIPVLLLLVLESEGSSPGRQGFKMAVAADGDISGTIGGGIMEHKLVEKARIMLSQESPDILLMRQHHDKQHAKDQSGMICSGSQLIAFIPIVKDLLPTIVQIEKSTRPQWLCVHAYGFEVFSEAPAQVPGYGQIHGAWQYVERLQHQPVVHIFGAGHVGLALSEVLCRLGFYVHIYDDREGLNTFEQNCFAQEKHLIAYEQVAETLQSTSDDYAVIMTIGYRQDKLVFRQLLSRPWFYLGMMGSDHKWKTLRAELAQEGMAEEDWKHVFAPIGVPIFSKTAQEIAISIAAEMIREKNKHLPTGRRCE